MANDCFINGVQYNVTDIERMKRVDFIMKNINNPPKSLFKYFSNRTTNNLDELKSSTFNSSTSNIVINKEQINEKNHSFEALKNNTVFMQNPKNYNDPYDSRLYINELDFINGRMKYYLNLANIEYMENDIFEKLCDRFAERFKWLSSQNSLNSLFLTNGNNRLEQSTELFLLRLIDFCNSVKIDSATFYDAVFNALFDECKSAIDITYESFRIACFTAGYDSMLMWSHYADNHKGFCIEYEIPPINDENRLLFINLYPVIYCNERSNIAHETLLDYAGLHDDTTLWSIYSKGLLRKSMDWKYENEWRLVQPNYPSEKSNKKFFRIKKVYLGTKMPPLEKKKIIDFCNSNGITYCGVTISSGKYKMQ